MRCVEEITSEKKSVSLAITPSSSSQTQAAVSEAVDDDVSEVSSLDYMEDKVSYELIKRISQFMNTITK